MLKLPQAYYESRSKPDTLKAELEPVEVANPEDLITQQVADKAVSSDTPTADIQTSAEVESKIDISWLPFAAKTYKISPDLDNYVIVNIPICPSDIPNRNGVAFPLSELIAFQPPPMNRLTYKAWTGCPVHLEHDNADCEKAIGIVFDTSLRVMKGYGSGKHYVVYGLIGIDKTKDPETAQKFLDKRMDTGSMGSLADYFTCSVCGCKASENQFTNCSHITSTQNVNWRIVDHMGDKVIAYLNAHVLSPIEMSCVSDPAWVTCLTEMVLDR